VSAVGGQSRQRAAHGPPTPCPACRPCPPGHLAPDLRRRGRGNRVCLNARRAHTAAPQARSRFGRVGGARGTAHPSVSNPMSPFRSRHVRIEDVRDADAATWPAAEHVQECFGVVIHSAPTPDMILASTSSTGAATLSSRFRPRMPNQDYQPGDSWHRRTPRREWDRTVLIVAADHGVHAPGTSRRHAAPPRGAPGRRDRRGHGRCRRICRNRRVALQ